MPDPLVIIAIVFGLFCVLFFIFFILALKKRKIFGAVRDLIFSLLMLSVSLLFATISISIQGYRALTHEELAASVLIEPLSDQSFIAYFQFPDNSESEFKLEGDEIYVDAHILKWKSIANLFGLHTLYELDRVAGRYSDLEQETTKERTVYSLASEKLIDAFNLRLKYEFLSQLVDAEYGSASFVNVREMTTFDIMVSTTGLLIRKSED